MIKLYLIFIIGGSRKSIKKITENEVQHFFLINKYQKFKQNATKNFFKLNFQSVSKITFQKT